VVLLTKYVINPKYLSDDVLKTAAKYFARENSLQLQQFLIPDVAQELGNALSKAPLKAQSIPDRFAYHEFTRLPAIAKQVGKIFATTHEIRKIISVITQKELTFEEAFWRAYTAGDYTLLHDENAAPPGYDVILDVTPRWDNRACGHHSYVDGRGNELARVPVVPNALAIIKKPATVLPFVKYVNHYAGKDRRIVLEARYA
jgi:hypothetical protein